MGKPTKRAKKTPAVIVVLRMATEDKAHHQIIWSSLPAGEALVIPAEAEVLGVA